MPKKICNNFLMVIIKLLVKNKLLKYILQTRKYLQDTYHCNLQDFGY